MMAKHIYNQFEKVENQVDTSNIILNTKKLGEDDEM